MGSEARSAAVEDVAANDAEALDVAESVGLF